MNSMQVYYPGLYLEESRINDRKYFAVIDNYKLLIWTTNKNTALTVLNNHKLPKNDQGNSISG